MGIYRLLLAIAVLLSHLGIKFQDRQMGVFAVVSFFLLSGYVMTALIDRYYNDPAQLKTFYLDRAMRLFPQFIFYLCATLILIAVAHPSSTFIAGLTPLKTLLNVVMLPLNFYAYFQDGVIIPQAWSLGLEAQFYLFIPLIIVFQLRTTVFLASFAFFLLAYFGILNSDTWGYRMLPGTLFMFLFGSFLYRRTSTVALGFAYVVIGALFAWIETHTALQFKFTWEVLAGLLCGIPAVWLLAKMRFGSFEELTGNLSYGVFLNHYFVIWLFQCLGYNNGMYGFPYAVVAVALVLAAISYVLIEKPVIALRHNVRKRATLPSPV